MELFSVLFMEACIMMKVHKVDQNVVLGLIASTVKFTPQQKDGDKYKVRPNLFFNNIYWEREKQEMCERSVEYEYLQ